MRKWSIPYIIGGTLVLLFISMSRANLAPCTANGKQVCFNMELQQFETEHQGQLTIYLQNIEQRDYLLSKIRDQVYQSQLRLIIRVVDEVLAWDAIMEHDVDIFYIQKEQAAMIVDQLMPLEPSLVELMNLNGLTKFLEVINDAGHVFTPYSYSGPLFVYNKTLLTQLGFDMEALDEKNRPVQLSDWTSIIEVNNQYNLKVPTINRKPLTALFPLTIDEPWQFYPFLTAGGWQMFTTNDASDPSFLSTDFFHSLLFIKSLGETNWDLTKTNNYSWRYEKTLLQNTAPMGIETEWMDVVSYGDRSNQEFIFTAFPKVGNKQPTPLVNVKGLVAKQNPFPSLTHEIIRILVEYDAVQLMLDTTDEILAIPIDLIDEFEMDPIKRQKSLAYLSSVSEPLVALVDNPQIRGWDFYLDGNHVDIIKEVFQQTLSPEQAQSMLIQRYQQWYQLNNGNGQ